MNQKSCFTLVALTALVLAGSANFAAAQRINEDRNTTSHHREDTLPPIPVVPADSNWTGGSGNWDSDASPGWNGTGVPNAMGAVANFGDTVTGTTTQNVVGGVTAGTISLTNNSNNSRTITNTNGITMNQDGGGAGFATISNANADTGTNSLQINTGILTLADDLLISNTGGSTNTTGAIQITSSIVGAGNVTFSNASNAVLQAGSIRLQTGVNTFVGSVLIQKGTVSYNLATAFGGVGNALTLGQVGQGGATLISTTGVGASNNITVASGTGGTLTLGTVSTAASGGTYSGGITLNGNVNITSQNTNPTNGLKFTGNITGAGGITKVQTGVAVFNPTTGVNDYAGGTSISAGQLTVLKDSALGTGNVSLLASGVTLLLQGGVANDYISDNATLSIVSGAAANLNFTGSDSVSGLVLGGVAQTDVGATYGFTGSGATHEFADFFLGAGTLTLIPEPSTWAMTIMGAGLLLGVQRFRRKKS